MAGIRILVVEDEAIIRKSFVRALQDEGFAVESAESGEQALQMLEEGPFDLVITDLRMSGVDGLEVLRRAKARYPQIEVVVLTGYGTIPSAVEAIKEGAYNYVTKPLNRHELLKIAREIAEKLDLRSRLHQLQSQLEERFGLHNLVGRSPAMQRVYDLIEKVREADCTVVITGESGTGKELVARAIHFTGPRAAGPFVAVNGGALPESLAESELFGHERGSFTGAVRAHTGYFESAHGGTLFLDEFTELSTGLQGKLLRVIQQREVLRVGSTKPIPINARLLAATNRDPLACLARGTLREDLFYRLSVVTVALPPLRERTEDVPLLADHILQRVARRLGQPARTLAPATLESLMAYAWPGNVRELENVIERAVMLSARPVIEPADLPRLGAPAPPPRPADAIPLPVARRRVRDSFEREAIVGALAAAAGNVTQAARALGIARSGLQRLMKRHGLRAERFR